MILSRSARIAIAAASALAEVHGTALTAQQISRRRGIPRPYVAKVLTALARARLIRGTRGPGGGYVLLRHPSRITLREIVACFDRNARPECPLGRDHCRAGRPCPLHAPMLEAHEAAKAFLAETTLGGFAPSAIADPTRRKRRVTE